MTIDLTPFNFTPTENAAYQTLLDLGPSTGYSLAKKLSIARANAYQALNGLVAKGAAVATSDRPTKYRANRPDAVFANLIERENHKLDVLQAQIASVPGTVQESQVEITGRRGLVDLAMRTAVREPGLVVALGPGDLLLAMAPAWRRRAADGRETGLWLLGETADFPFASLGAINRQSVARYFETDVLIMTTSAEGIVSRLAGLEAHGFWVTDLVVLGLIRATLAHLTD